MSGLGNAVALKVALDTAGITVPVETWLRFWGHVDPTFDGLGCWLWTGATREGYGAFKLDGEVHGAHRLAGEWTKGPLTDDEVIDHLCGNRICVRPEHLDVTTRGDNIRRGSDPHFHLAGTSS